MVRSVIAAAAVSVVGLLSGCATQNPSTIVTRAHGEPIGLVRSMPLVEAQQKLVAKCGERGMKVVERTDERLVCGHRAGYTAGAPSEAAMGRVLRGRYPQEGMAFGFVTSPQGLLVHGHEWREVEGGGMNHELKVVRLTATEPMEDISAVLWSIGARNLSDR